MCFVVKMMPKSLFFKNATTRIATTNRVGRGCFAPVQVPSFLSGSEVDWKNRLMLRNDDQLSISTRSG
jgi:hypothetical protein